MANNIGITDAILAIKSDAQVSVNSEDINSIIWHDDNPTNITNEQILTKQTELQTAYDAEVWKRNRQAEYPSWQDQMDMLWHSIDENAELKQKYFAFYEAIKAVKAKYPK